MTTFLLKNIMHKVTHFLSVMFACINRHRQSLLVMRKSTPIQQFLHYFYFHMSQPLNHVFNVGLALEMNSVYDRFK